MDLLSSLLTNRLEDLDYEPHDIRLIEGITGLAIANSEFNSERVDEKYHSRMDAGDKLREAVSRPDALALVGCAGIVRERGKQPATGQTAVRNAYILRSLKRPEEVITLRWAYGSRFLVVAAYSPEEDRLDDLARRISRSWDEFGSTEANEHAQRLLRRDLSEGKIPLGQNVRDTFPLADAFVNVADPEGAKNAISRLVELLFGHPFHTPTPDECGMFYAHSASLRSSALSRQVGSAITTQEGSLVSLGTNEVPRAGGGLYWPGPKPDPRDFAFGHNPTRMKRSVLADIIKRMQDDGLVVSQAKDESSDGTGSRSVVDRAMRLMEDSKLMDLIEFERPVHAEMAALMDAAQRGVSVDGCHLFSTTFPCHHCAKHIIAAGIRRVVYIEPYPKSLGPEFYAGAMLVDKPGKEGPGVRFEPFVGVAPRQFRNMFSMATGSQRRTAEGDPQAWEKSRSVPRFFSGPGLSIHYLHEQILIDTLEDLLVKANLITKDASTSQSPEAEGK
jgi:cytidine deaminase